MASWYSSNSGLADRQMQHNARLFFDNMSYLGWSREAVMGALGNIQQESTVNPGICERGLPENNTIYYGGGLGLIQWTDYPSYTATKPHPLLWYAQLVRGRWNDGDLQCKLLNEATNPDITWCGLDEGARWGWIDSSTYPTTMSFEAYKAFDGDVETACEAFYYCMEWHSPIEEGSLSRRKGYAASWHEYFKTYEPGPPNWLVKRKGMPVWMMVRYF